MSRNWKVLPAVCFCLAFVSIHSASAGQARRMSCSFMRLVPSRDAGIAQAAMSWPDTTETDRHAGARLAETIERIRSRLWHGQVKCALDLVAETVVDAVATADQTEPMTAAGGGSIISHERIIC